MSILSAKNKIKVFVAMSGGVDSSVAAALLKDEGYDVTGAHIICWQGCENNQDKQDAMRVAARLKIPFLVWDFKKEYREAVFNYMVREYREGRTPNPDVMCNKKIKFGIFLKKTLEAGADFVATGHYVISSEDTRSGGPGFFSADKTLKTRAVALRTSSISDISEEKFYTLFSAKDKSKDQSYFLWTLTQDQLKHCLFPVGNYLKSEVRELARRFDLPTAEKKDSQGLCFVGNIDFGEFLRSELPKKQGDVLLASGEKIGEHDGSIFYTLGQRHGLNIGGQAESLYVAEKDFKTNTLIVAKGESDPILYKKELVAENCNWLMGSTPKFPLECQARIRYRQPLQNCKIFEDGKVIFEVPQRAISPGQSIVFYAGDEMLGGAIIIE